MDGRDKAATASGWVVPGWGRMSNHGHVAIETPGKLGRRHDVAAGDFCPAV